MASDTQTTTNGSNFFSSGLRQKVDQLMNILWAGGVNNPMDAIEQLSYLIFLRLLSERDEQAARLHPPGIGADSRDRRNRRRDRRKRLSADSLLDLL